jgi:hypothetical protein
MSCPQPSAEDIDAMLGKVNTLVANVQEATSCDEECQNQRAFEVLKTKLEDAKANQEHADENYNNANRAVIINQFGVTHYNNLEEKKKQENIEKKIQANIDYFLIALNSTKVEVKSLEKEMDSLNLIKKMYENNNVTNTLSDIFGIEVPASALKSDFQENFENLEDFENKLDMDTLNRKIWYEFNKNARNEQINKILYIVYYVILLAMSIYLFTREFTTIDKNKKIVLCVLFFLYPYLKFLLLGIYNVFIIVYRFVT